MTRRRAVLGTLMLAFSSQPLSAWAQVTPRSLPPKLRAISDEIGALTPEEGSRLAGRLADLQAETGTRVIVLIAETTRPESIEAYVRRLVEHWRGQTEALENGRFFFVVVARADRALRIVSGAHHLGIMTEAIESGLIAEALPLLREARYHAALDTIVSGLARLLKDARTGGRAFLNGTADRIRVWA